MKLSRILTAAATVTAMLGASTAIAAASAQPVAAKLSTASAQALRIGGIQKRAKSNLNETTAVAGGLVILGTVGGLAAAGNSSQAVSP